MNEERFIGLCMESLASVRYPAGLLEVIGADNGSTDTTLEIVRSFSSRMNLKVLLRADPTVSGLRSFAAACSSGERFVFLDAVCVSPDWLEQSMKVAESSARRFLALDI